jgi:DNA polymerase V
MKVIDGLNAKIGDKKIKLTQNLSLTWNMKQNHLSPRYTTSFKDILEIKCSKSKHPTFTFLIFELHSF